MSWFRNRSRGPRQGLRGQWTHSGEPSPRTQSSNSTPFLFKKPTVEVGSVFRNSLEVSWHENPPSGTGPVNLSVRTCTLTSKGPCSKQMYCGWDLSYHASIRVIGWVPSSLLLEIGRNLSRCCSEKSSAHGEHTHEGTVRFFGHLLPPLFHALMCSSAQIPKLQGLHRHELNRSSSLCKPMIPDLFSIIVAVWFCLLFAFFVKNETVLYNTAQAGLKHTILLPLLAWLRVLFFF